MPEIVSEQNTLEQIWKNNGFFWHGGVKECVREWLQQKEPNKENGEELFKRFQELADDLDEQSFSKNARDFACFLLGYRFKRVKLLEDLDK